MPHKIRKIKRPKQAEVEEEGTLKMATKSPLQRLSTQVETKQTK